MHASIKQKQSAFEKKVLAMENGFNNFPVPNADLNFGKEVLTPNEVVQRFQGYLTIIQNVETTREAHQAAMKACERAIPAAHAFLEEAVVVVKAHFGSDPKILATFGLGSPRKHPKATPLLVIEEVMMPPKGDANAVTAFASHDRDGQEDDANAVTAFASKGSDPERAGMAVAEAQVEEPLGGISESSTTEVLDESVIAEVPTHRGGERRKEKRPVVRQPRERPAKETPRRAPSHREPNPHGKGRQGPGDGPLRHGRGGRPQRGERR